MKNLLIISLLFISCFTAKSQIPPEAFNYSAVLRGNNGQALPNHLVALRFSILKGSNNGPIQYQEIHVDTTNQWGSINLSIGYGQVTQGNFSSINWGNDFYYLQIELDDNGNTNFQLMGTQKFLSVPYALYAKNVLNINCLDSSNTNELQTLTISNDTIYLSQGGSAILPHIPENISELINDIGFITQVNDGDTSATNELQTLSISNDTIYLSNGGFVRLPPSYVGTNTDEQQLSISNDTIALTNGGSIVIPTPERHYVGEIYGGGMIFYVYKDASGIEHGLIVSLNDLSPSALWGLYGSNVQNSVSSWNGKGNTNAIITAGCLNSDAAGLCATYTGGTYIDWYLPSILELNLIWSHLFALNKSLSTISGATEILLLAYWSSTSGSNPDYASSFWFQNGFISGQTKNTASHVRAVRSF